jgi:hypothetical protein
MEKEKLYLIRRDMMYSWQPQLDYDFDEKQVSTYFHIFQNYEDMKKFGTDLRNSQVYLDRMKDKQFKKKMQEEK